MYCRTVSSIPWDMTRIRSRIEVETYNGRTLTKWADENYRGGPDNPISDDELIKKFRVCTERYFDAGTQNAFIKTIARLETLPDARILADHLVFQ